MHHQGSCCAASPIMLPAATMLVPKHLGLTLWLSWPHCNPPHVSIVLVAFTHYQYVHVGLWGYVAVWLCARGVMWLCGCVHVGLCARGVVCMWGYVTVWLCGHGCVVVWTWGCVWVVGCGVVARQTHTGGLGARNLKTGE